jgi:hypothetical protein
MGGAAAMLARSGTSSPSDDEIRAALDRVIAIEALHGSPQLIAFLRFVVEATLRDERHLIKAYTIAVQVLGRDAGFDANTDPIVRVQAGRLRRALKRYYAGPGAADSIVIHIPLGRYVPEFQRRERKEEAVIGNLFSNWRNQLSRLFSVSR